MQYFAKLYLLSTVPRYVLTFFALKTPWTMRKWKCRATPYFCNHFVNSHSFFIKQAKELPLQETNDVNCESETSEEKEPQSKDPHEQPEVPVPMV